MKSSKLIRNAPEKYAPQTVEAQAIKPSKQQKGPQQKQQSDQPVVQYQAIANLTGCLTVADDKLYLLCPDGVLLPIVGINSRLSAWLIARPAVMFSQDAAGWICYPKSDRKGNLTIFLKGRVNPEKPRDFSIAPNAVHICGKLLNTDGDRLTIGIRRNLSPNAFKELFAKGMIQGSEFDQFTVNVWGTVAAEVGAIVDLQCSRNSDRLVVS